MFLYWVAGIGDITVTTPAPGFGVYVAGVLGPGWYGWLTGLAF